MILLKRIVIACAAAAIASALTEFLVGLFTNKGEFGVSALTLMVSLSFPLVLATFERKMTLRGLVWRSVAFAVLFTVVKLLWQPV